MAKKKTSEEQLNIKPVLLKGPKFLIQAIKSSIKDVNTTKVISTWVIESENILIKVLNQGKTLFSGVVKWIGNRNDGAKGTVLCIASNKDLKIIRPTSGTIKDAVLNVEKKAIGLNTVSNTKCSVCGKGLNIFDEQSSCPLCNAPAHKEHLREWVKMRNTCPVCKKEITLDPHSDKILAKN